MTSTKILFAAAALAAVACAGSASAKGCNGYVNQAVWGCAVWDNNNGPQYPHYVKPAPAPTTSMMIKSAAAPSAAAKVATGSAAAAAAGIVAQGGGNLKGANGIVAQGGGNLKPN